MLVWNAMPSITPMMSAIRRELSLIAFIVPTTSLTTSPPRTATLDALRASWLAWRALSAFCLTVELSSSIDAAVSSSAEACCSVRFERSLLPSAIWLEPLAMLSLLARTCATMAASASRMRPSAATMLRSSAEVSRRDARSPCAIALATAAASLGSPPTERQIERPIQKPAAARPSAASSTSPICVHTVIREVAAKLATDASAKAVESLTVSSTPVRWVW